jgi:Family of unknown function (DUF6334)
VTLWVCENDQGYQDQVIFALENLQPSIAFVTEGAVIKAFRQESIRIVSSTTDLQPHTEVFRETLPSYGI